MKANYSKVAYCTIFLVIVNITIYSQDNWSWLNPKPMGSSIESCSYFPGTNTVIAVGANGLIMRSTDNGTNWSHVNSNLVNKLTSVSLTSSTTGYIAGESATLLKTTDAGVSWYSINTGLSGAFNQIDFVDNTNGFLRQGSEINKIYKTTSGGNSWIELPINGYYGNLTTLNALSSTEILYGTSTGNVIKTSAPSWSLSIVKKFTGDLQVVSIAVNGSRVVAASADQLLVYSTDYGTSWSSEITLPGISFAGVEFISASNLVAYTASDEIRISTDGGAAWLPVTTSPTQQLVTAAANLSGHGIILGTLGNQYNTVNFGLTWSRTSTTSSSGILRSITYNAPNILASEDNGQIIRSTDNGANWSTISVAGGTTIQDIKFINSNTAFLVAGAKFYKSIDAGATWSLKKTFPLASLYELACFNESDIIVAGSVQTTYRSIDGGETWSDTNQVPVAGTLNTVFALEGTSSAYCAGTSGKVFKSNDKGAIWTVAGNASGTINSIWFSTPAIGWAVGFKDSTGNPGQLLKSTDGGVNWNLVPNFYTTTLQSVRFSDANNGIIVGNGGVIYKTVDGGTTWTKSAQVTDKNLMSAALIDGSTTLVAGYAGTVIKSYNAPLPVELTSFSASVRNNTVNLNWETATEVDNYGFDIERKDNNSTWTKIGFIEGHTTSNSPKYYEFSDKPTGSGKYSYRLKQIDNDGKFEYSNEVEVLIDNLPDGYLLEQNYPNPFNPETSIKFVLKENTKASLKVYNALGELVTTLFDGIADAGRYYDIKFNGNNLASGLYIYTLDAGKYRQTRKMMLMK